MKERLVILSSSELACATWRKSSRSQAGNCVEVAFLSAGSVGVRDSKNPTGPVLIFDGPQWTDFVASVKNGSVDRA